MPCRVNGMVSSGQGNQHRKNPMRLIHLCTPFLALFAGAAFAADAPCGRDDACQIEGGSYHLLLPEGWETAGSLPAVVFFHGHNSSGRSVFRAGSLKSEFVEKGYAVIAPNGDRQPGRNTRFWPARPNDAGYRDDVAFTLRVLDDAETRVPLDTSRLYVTGFSAGGSMAWMMACYAGGRFDGVVSVAGALRRPVPQANCPGQPVRALQIHGFTDNQVPLEGRTIRDWHQGDVYETLGIFRQTNGCRSNPDTITADQPFRCRIWNSCSGQPVKLCLHDGGHGLPKGWATIAREWFELPQAAN